jgi:hypothetical protein
MKNTFRFLQCFAFFQLSLLAATLALAQSSQQITAWNLNGTIFVDNNRYPFTSAGLQAAINAACNGTVEGRVVLPANQTLVANPSIPNHCTVEGQGEGSVIQSDADRAIVSASSPAPEHITLRNFHIDGGSSTHAGNQCIRLTPQDGAQVGPTDILLENLYCTNTGGYGWQVSGSRASIGDRLTVRNIKTFNGGLSGAVQLYCGLFSFVNGVEITDVECSSAGFDYGLVSFGDIPTNSPLAIHGISIKGAQIHDIGQIHKSGGTAIDIGRVRGVSVTASNFRNIGSGESITFESVWSGSINGNTVDTTVLPEKQSSIAVISPDTIVNGDVGSADIAISGNTIYQPSGGSSAMVVNGSLQGIAITGNVILVNTKSPLAAILLQPGSSDPKLIASGWGIGQNITVTGNTLTNMASLSENASSGIEIIAPTARVVDQVVVSNNTARGFGTGVAWGAYRPGSNPITHLYVHDNGLDGNTVAVTAGDARVYSSAYHWNNLGPAGSLNNFFPPLDSTFNGSVAIHGNLTVSGGVKHFVVPDPTSADREIAYVSLEGPEVGTYCRGSATLPGRRATVKLPRSFALVTAGAGITAQVTSDGPGTGLYILTKSPEELVVSCDVGAACPKKFDWLVQGVRRGYENYQPLTFRSSEHR